MSNLTGLPELPEGFYWNVERIGIENNNNFAYYYLNIRRRVRVFGGLYTKTEEVFSLELRPGDLTPEKIRERAGEALKVWNTKRTEAERVNSLLGDYPPKTLT